MKYVRNVEISKERADKITALLNINNLQAGDYSDIGAKEDDAQYLYSVKFDDGAIITIDLFSGQLNYWLDIVLYTSEHAAPMVLDAEYELGDIDVFATNGNEYLVHFDVTEHNN